MRAGNSNVSSVFFLLILSLVVFCFLYVFFCDVLVREFTWWIQHSFFASCHHLFIPKLLFFILVTSPLLLLLLLLLMFCAHRFVVIKFGNRVSAIRYLMGYIYVLTLFSDYVGKEMRNDSMNCLGRMNSRIIAAASVRTVKKEIIFSRQNTKFNCWFWYVDLLISFDFAISQWHMSLLTGSKSKTCHLARRPHSWDTHTKTKKRNE